MARTYSSFLLFEDVLDHLPSTAAPIMVQAVNILKSPMIKVVEEDCGTLLGELVDTSFDLEGLVEVATGVPLTQVRIRQVLSLGQYQIGTRTLHTCLSSLKGGICRACYSGSYLGEVPPAVGSNLTITSKLIYQSDVITGNAYTSKFSLTQTSDDYYFVKVIHKGLVLDPSNYTLGYDFIQFPILIPLDPVEGVYTVHFYAQSTEPFQGLVSKSYSGALLGMQPLPTNKTLLRKSLYEVQFSDNFLALILEVLAQFPLIPSTYFEYIDRLHDRLEKVLFMLYLYVIYSNIQV